MGVFVPFKDYKGNIIDAMNKLIKDLKIFGYSNWRNLKVESLRMGYSEQVCDVITEVFTFTILLSEYS